MFTLFSRLRGLPLVLLLALPLLTVKIGALWQGTGPLDVRGFTVTDAEASSGGSAASKPANHESAVPANGAESVSPPSNAEKDADSPACSPAEIELLQQLAKRRETLEARAGELDRREDLIGAAQKKLDERVSKLQNLKAGIERVLQTIDDQNEGKLKSLVKIYENMKPRDAARIFEELNMQTLLSVAERMNERKLAPVLAEMSPTKAKDVTVELARLRQLLEATPPAVQPPATPNRGAAPRSG